MKGKLVAIRHNDNNECIDLLEVKTLDDKEYAKRVQEFHKVEEANKKHKQSHGDLISALENHTETLDLHKVCLAKALYDNYVDRGIIDEDEEFQKAFANFLFRGVELKLEETPTDFKKILERLGK